MLLPACLQGQSADQPTVALTFYGGLATGQPLWRIGRQPLCVWQTVVGGYQCEQGGSATVNDTLTLSRRATLGTNLGMAVTFFRSSHVGFRIALSYLNESLEDQCTPAVPFQTDSVRKNAQVCDSFSSSNASLSIITLSGGVEFRVAAQHAISPYVRIGGGLALQSGETLAASGTFFDPNVPGQPIERAIVSDSSASAIRPYVEFGLGLTSGIGRESRFRLELSDALVPLEQLTGPADASGRASRGMRLFNNPSLTLGIDLVLGSHHGRRY